MNQERRNIIQLAIDKLSEARTMLEVVYSEEQAYFDEMPDGLREGDRGTKAEETIQCLDETASTLADLESLLADIMKP